MQSDSVSQIIQILNTLHVLTKPQQFRVMEKQLKNAQMLQKNK